jgi:hypothetical protein
MSIWTRASNLIDQTGTALNLPEWGISEFVSPTGSSVNTGTSARSVAANYSPVSYRGSGQPTATHASLPTTDPVWESSTGPVGGTTQPQQVQPTGGGGPAPVVYEHFGDPNNPDLSNPVKVDDYNRHLQSIGQGDPLARQRDEEQRLIDEMYEPAKAYYEGLEDSWREGAQLAEGRIGTDYEQSEEQAELRERQQLGLIDEEQTRITDAERDALGQAARQFNEHMQGILGRFGSRVTTGTQLSELLARESARMMGGIGRSTEEARRHLANEARTISDFVSTQKQNLLTKKQDALAAMNKELDDKLLAIQGMRGQLESDKIAQKIDAIRNFQDKAFAIDQADRAFNQQLGMFERQKNAELENMIAASGIAGQTSGTLRGAHQNLIGGTWLPTAAGGSSQSVTRPGTAPSSVSPSYAAGADWHQRADGVWENSRTGEISTSSPAVGGGL